MCGIIGVKGEKALSLTAKGLVILEYRGYDSFGIGVKRGRRFRLFKEADPEGKRGPWAVLGRGAPTLEEALRNAEEWAAEFSKAVGGAEVAVGHTRWATHGEVSRENAHPHVVESVMVVHNGITSNTTALRRFVEGKGYTLRSQTDTEVIGALIDYHYRKSGDPLKAIRDALARVEGAYALLILFRDKDEMFFARRGQPLVVHESLTAVASDAEAFAPMGGHYSVVEDNTAGALSGLVLGRLHPVPTLDQVGKGSFSHFMRKEIEEQREVFANAFAVDVAEARKAIEGSGWVFIVGAGTSYNAGMVFQHYWYERNARLSRAQPVILKYGHEAYFPAPQDSLVLAISQSGETADVVEAIRNLKPAVTVGVLNRTASTIASLSDIVVPIQAYTEIGVAATKSYTNQLIVLLRIAEVALSQEVVGDAIAEALSKEEAILEVARELAGKEGHFTFLGKGPSKYIAREVKLKVQEVAQQGAESLPIGEVKHGPIALAGNGSIYIAFMPWQEGEMWSKAVGELEKLLARKAPIYVFTARELPFAEKGLRVVLFNNRGTETLFSYVVAGQLLAYHLAVLRGLNPDRPVNLAKSVTVG